MSFAAIEATGRANWTYDTTDHYVAQFLRSNPKARYWEVDASQRRIRAVAVPSVPKDAIQLPAPSGGNDTAAVQAVIDRNPGGSFVGRGTYRIANLKLSKSGTRIWNMPMVPHSSTSQFVTVSANDVRVYSSPIDAKLQGSAGTGWEVTGDDFHLINSGYKNMRHTAKQSAAGVRISGGAADYHLAGNTFDHIVNASGNSATHRANPFWVLGGSNTSLTSGGGYIVSNTASRAQSNGKLVDSDFLTVQSHDAGYDGLVKVFANITVDSGKRAIKAQTGGILALSNKFEWREATGPLGTYKRVHMLSVQTGFNHNFTGQNNEIIVGGARNWTNLFNISYQRSPSIWSNIHFDHNWITIEPQPVGTYDQVVIMLKSCSTSLATNDSSKEPKSSSFNNNVITGSGAVNAIYQFGNGMDRASGTFETSGNDISIDIERRTDLTDETPGSAC